MIEVELPKAQVRIVGMDEQVELRRDGRNEFITLAKGEMATVLGHEVEEVGGTHVLSDKDLDILGTAVAVRDRFKQLGEGFEPDTGATELRIVGTKLAEQYGRETGMRILRFGLSPFLSEDRITKAAEIVLRVPGKRTLDDSKNFTVGIASELLGRKVELDGDGHHVLDDQEVQLLGTAAGALDAIHEVEIGRTAHIISESVKKVREEFGERPAKRLLAMLHREIKIARRERQERIADQTRELVDLGKQRAAIEELAVWTAEIKISGIRLQRPEGSYFHKIKEACHARELLPIFVNDKQPERMATSFDGVAHSFVVEHNWSAAFKGAGDFDQGEIGLPYPISAFEFAVNGRRVCVIAEEGEPATVALLLIQTKAGWVMPATYRYDSGRMTLNMLPNDPALATFQPVADLIGANVRAISITLEAEVTETTIVRADHKLNRAREKRGKLPLLDYHVVSLAHRTRAPSLPRGELDPDREIIHKRAHYRRGHWRHYENHKTWIRWMLCGDPDLGFVEKHYRL